MLAITVFLAMVMIMVEIMMEEMEIHTITDSLYDEDDDPEVLFSQVYPSP